MNSDDREGRPLLWRQTFARPSENVAAEQMLLEYAESMGRQVEIIRIWEPRDVMVVLGRGGRIDDDVFLEQCRADGVPVLRRISGGGTIVAGAGCLMYTAVLSLESRPELRDIGFCHQFFGNRLQSIYQRCGHDIRLQGHSDLCWGDRKFSGNALRLGRSHLIYHGTLLVDFDLTLISRYLKLPPRRPEYRDSRPHLEFVTNLPVEPEPLIESIREEFGARPGTVPLDEGAMQQLLRTRYESDAWNLRF